jgi:hypothetical protein
MKIFNINLLTGLGAVLLLTSCLKKNDMNIDPDAVTGSVAELQFIENGSGTTINSGMQYFAGGALLLSPLDDVDTVNYSINIAGASAPGKDVNVTIGVKKSAILDNYSNDAINYELMPDSIYDFVSTSATIKAGSRLAGMQIKFYPSKIDFTKSYMLPVEITDASGVTVSSNFGIVYFHIIGNPIAGSYLWDFYRYNNQDGSGSPSTTWTNDQTVFVPVTPTSVKVPTGYYVQPNYLITFTNTNGVLSDFKAVIAPDEIDAAFTANGITVTSGPTINVSADQKTFTIKYVVYNGSAYRNLTDIYHKP